MEEQKHIVSGEGDMGGTMRLGLYPAELAEGSLVRATYGSGQVSERHRHRYEVNNGYRGELEQAGLVFSGTSPGRLAGRVRRAAARRPPVLRRRPRPTPSCGRGPTGRTRSSPGWWRRRWTGSGRAGWSRSSGPREAAVSLP